MVANEVAWKSGGEEMEVEKRGGGLLGPKVRPLLSLAGMARNSNQRIIQGQRPDPLQPKCLAIDDKLPDLRPSSFEWFRVPSPSGLG